jgi:hypothetical protein
VGHTETAAGKEGTMSGHGSRVTIAAVAAAAGLLLAAVPAQAGTWYISPTVSNQSSDTVYQVQKGIEYPDGDWVTNPGASVSSGGSNSYEYKAPKLDTGADASVTYNMPDGTESVNMTQDDVNGGYDAELASPTCINPDPTGPTPQYACTATFGDVQGPYDPSNSNFTPFFTFFDNGVGGGSAAPVAAAGQTCSASMTVGDSAACTTGQPTTTGISPPDPNAYMNLTFVNQGPNPVTVTVTNQYFQSLAQQYPGGRLFDGADYPSEQPILSPTTSCTMSGWGNTCSVQTYGGASSNLWFGIGQDDSGGPFYSAQDMSPLSDQISISPAGAPDPQNTWSCNSGGTCAWYGVQLYIQSEVGHTVEDGETLAEFMLLAFDSFFSTIGQPIYSNEGEVGAVRPAQSVRPGWSLPPGRAIEQGPYRLTMRRSGNLVEDVHVNRHRFPVWSSRTRTPGSRLILQHDGNLVVKDRRGHRHWSTHTHGKRVRNLKLQANGRLVLRSSTRRHLFATRAVSFPFPARRDASSLTRDIGLHPGAELRRRGARLWMRLDGNLVLYRHGKRRWSTHTEGHPGAYAHLRGDGNLVVATPHRKVLWSSHTRRRGARLVLTARGTLILRSRAGKRIWAA